MKAQPSAERDRSRTREPLSAVASEVEELHARCGVYTKLEIVKRILDAVGWTESADLSGARLLEPAAGGGVFVAEAARRLVGSLRRVGHELTVRQLGDRIRAFELHAGEVDQARGEVERVLSARQVHASTARSCARRWIAPADFLLHDFGSTKFTHIVGNPPFVRWSKLPLGLKGEYEAVLPAALVGGDLFLPFLARAIDLLDDGGRCGMICSDRWRHMAFAETFRRDWLPLIDLSSEESVTSEAAFERLVDSYPSIFVAVKRCARKAPVSRTGARGLTLQELGCEVRVGPALGCREAFVLEKGENGVESALLAPWVEPSEIEEGSILWRGRRVLVLHRQEGDLLDLSTYPEAAARLERYREKLKKRAIVRAGAPWYKPIDRVRKSDWLRPKLLVPEIAKIPRLAIDRTGAIPSHGVYAIFHHDDDVDAIYEILRDGGLEAGLRPIAPSIKGGYLRCYRRFLLMARFGGDS